MRGFDMRIRDIKAECKKRGWTDVYGKGFLDWYRANVEDFAKTATDYPFVVQCIQEQIFEKSHDRNRPSFYNSLLSNAL